MKFLTRQIVSNSWMIQNYNVCRKKAELFGKIFILKNNQPDAVLFSITEYERLSVFIEYLKGLNEKETATFTASLPKKGSRGIYSLENLKDDLKDVVETA